MISENEKVKKDQDYVRFQFNQLHDAKLQPDELELHGATPQTITGMRLTIDSSGQADR